VIKKPHPIYLETGSTKEGKEGRVMVEDSKIIPLGNKSPRHPLGFYPCGRGYKNGGGKIFLQEKEEDKEEEREELVF
jgi:hypothetical protein